MNCIPRASNNCWSTGSTHECLLCELIPCLPPARSCAKDCHEELVEIHCLFIMLGGLRNYSHLKAYNVKGPLCQLRDDMAGAASAALPAVPSAAHITDSALCRSVLHHPAMTNLVSPAGQASTSAACLQAMLCTHSCLLTQHIHPCTRSPSHSMHSHTGYQSHTIIHIISPTQYTVIHMITQHTSSYTHPVTHIIIHMVSHTITLSSHNTQACT